MTSQLVRVLGAVILFAVSLAAASAPPQFDRIERELKLRPEQKLQFDIAIASTQRALISVALSMVKLKQQLAYEVGKPIPDFTTLANQHAALLEQNRPLFEASGDEWKKFYAMLDADQLRVAKKSVMTAIDDLFAEIAPGLGGWTRLPGHLW